MKDPRQRALEAFARDFGNKRQRSRMAITVSPGESKQNYLITVLGIIPDRSSRACWTATSC